MIWQKDKKEVSLGWPLFNVRKTIIAQRKMASALSERDEVSAESLYFIANFAQTRNVVS